MFSFLFPFLHFIQPGILLPELADYRPMQIAGLLALLSAFTKRGSFQRTAAFKQPAFVWLVLYVLVQALSVYETGTSGMFSELGFWFAYVQFVVISIAVIPDEAAFKRYIWGVVSGGMVVVIIGIYSVFAGLASAVGGRAGAYGMYENHNDYTFLIIQNIPLICALMRLSPGAFGRWFLRVALALCSLGVFLSLSRGGILALVLEYALIVWLTMEKRYRRILLPIVFLIGFAAVGYQFAKRAENQGDAYTAEDAETSRYELWRAGRAMITAHPILGVGSRTFGEHATQYAEISHDNLGKNSHNTFIEVLTSSGMLGFLSFYKMLKWSWRSFRRPDSTDRSAAIRHFQLAGMIILYSIIFRSFFDAKTHDWSYYVLIVIGLACAAAQRSMPATAVAFKNMGHGSAH